MRGRGRFASVERAELERLVGAPLTDAEAEALQATYTALAEQVARFPEMKDVEPPLRSWPGPRG
jgi:hypothetical protein